MPPPRFPNLDSLIGNFTFYIERAGKYFTNYKLESFLVVPEATTKAFGALEPNGEHVDSIGI